MADKKNNIKQVLLENERLKRMIKRVSKSAMGTMRAGGTDDQPDHSIEFLPVQISAILMADMPLDNRLNKVLEKLGKYVDVSRVYIFENFDNNNKCRNSFEWVNQGVTSHRNELEDLDYSDFPYWKKILVEKGSIVVSNIREQLPETCWEILEKQDIKSILAFPLYVKGDFWGFIGFDKCSFEREWTPFEVNILNVTAQLISNAIENQFANNNLEVNIKLQELLLRISNMFITSDSFIDQLNNSLDLLGNFFEVDRAYIFENSSNTTFCSFMSEWCNKDISCKKEKFPVLNYSTDLPEWHRALLDKGFISSEMPDQSLVVKKSLLYNSEETHSLIIFPIKSQYHFWGFIGFDDYKTDKKWSSLQRNALETIAGILAGAFERKQANEENRRNHANILRINKQLKEKEGFLSHILSVAPIGIMITKNRKITFVNYRAVQSTGFSEEELIGQSPQILYDRTTADENKINDFYNLIKTSGIGTMEITVVTKDGKKIPVQLTGTPASFDESSEGSYLLIGLDISDIKQAEQKLIDSQNRIKTIIETTIDGILICEKPDKFSYINKASVNMLGYTSKQLLNMPIETIFPDEKEKLKYLKAFKMIDEKDEFKGDIQVRNSNGDILFLETSGTSVILDNKKQYYFSLHDVTNRINNERALQLSEEKFRTLTENSRDHILRIDHDGRVSYCNSSFLDEYGFSSSEIIDKKFSDISNLPTEFVRSLWPKINAVLKNGIVTNIELVIHFRGRYLVFDWTITPESNVTGEPHSVLVVGRDFTKRKKTEQELILAKDKAESADKLKSAFLANMSHEIRTPLNAIVGFANLLKEDLIDKEEKEEYINIINKSSDNLMMLINDIIDLARIESGQLTLRRGELHLNGMLNALYKTFKQRAKVERGDNVSIILSTPDTDTPLYILADENRLIQIFNNLLGNALKFTIDGFVEFGYTVNDDMIRLFVRDTGIGIVHEKHSIIFDQFRQADEAIAKKYGGTGLGLTICKKLVNAMGGEIGLISEPGEGTEFYFTIPLIPAEHQKLPEVKEKKEPVAVTHHVEPNKKYEWPDKMILLVDDNSSAHLQLRKYLEKTGVTVISARTGTSARELLRKRTDISMVLMDIQMTDINGVSFIKEMKEQGITVPVIAQTTEETLKNADDILKAGYDEFVSKPINRDELLNKMDKFLNKE